MKKILFIVLLFSLQLSAQKEANFWYFGENAGLDFSSGSPVALDNGRLNTLEGCSTISDRDGSLLFYTDGSTLYNRNHEVMNFESNGDLASNLGGNSSSTQSGLFVPNPSNENIYYLFTIGTDFVGRNGTPNPGFKFYTIDKTLNNNLGQITFGPVNLAQDSNNIDISDSITEKLTAIQDDCNNIWVIASTFSEFYAYKITGSGVDTDNPVISETEYTFSDKRGYLKASPDGRKIVAADYNGSGNSNLNNNSALILYDFNSETGEISSSFTSLTNPNADGSPYGVEFSSQSNNLYTFSYNVSRDVINIIKFDVTQDNIPDTRELIHTENGGFRGALQLAPDGKIYVSIPNRNFLDVIENPNSNNPRYTKEGVHLASGTTTEQGLPPFIQSFFAPVNLIDNNNRDNIVSGTVQELCEDEILEIRPEIDFSSLTVQSLSWTKENDNSVNVSSENFTINKNLGSGVYLFEATATNDCGRLQVFTNSIEVIFNDKPVINSIPIFEECDFDENPTDFITNFKLSSRENQIYSGTDNVTINFFETTDTTFSKPLNKEEYRNSTPTETSNHQLVAKVTNDKGCFETVAIELKVNSSGLTFYKDVFLCELDNNSSSLKSNGTGNSTFDFNEKTAQIISASNGALNITDYNFDYFLTREDVNLKQNKIVPPFESLYENETNIFIRISLKATNNCESIGQFKIIVRELPMPQGDTEPILLCVSNPIVSPQPNTVSLNANTGVSTDSYVWYLNDEEIIGQTAGSLNVNKAGNYRVEAFRVYNNSTLDNSDDIVCSGYNTFTVFTSNEPIITEVSVLDNQDSFQDNSITIKVDGIGEYEYAINSTLDSDFNKGTENLSFTFTNVSAGLNVIYIKDRNGCGTLTKSETISFLYFQRHFTPNGDGKFDVWKVQGIDNDFYTSISYQIYDRYGKLLKNINQKIEDGWNGNFNGSPLPEDDYWYNIVLVDINGKVIKKTGHFSLIRE